MIIHHTSVTGALEAVKKAKSFIQEAERTNILPYQLEPDFVPGHVCEDVLVPKEKVGLVIGKKGEKIKRLQEGIHWNDFVKTRNFQIKKYIKFHISLISCLPELDTPSAH